MEFLIPKVSDVKKEMGRLIKKMRASRRLTQAELAAALNLSRITIQNIERGNNFTIDSYLLVCQYFGELKALNDFIQSKMEEHGTIKSIY